MSFNEENGVFYNGGKCYSMVENCEGFTRVMELEAGKFCVSFPFPAQK